MAMAAKNKVSPDKFFKDLKKNNGLGRVQEQLLLELAVDFLVDNAVIEEVPAAIAPASA